MSRWYGSLENRLAEMSGSDVKINVGTLCTEMCYSDRHPYEVVEVIDDRHVKVRRLNAKRVDNNGMSESQEYTYTRDANATPIMLFKKKDGRWVEKYPDRHLGCDGFVFGFAEEYYDFSF